MNLSQGLGEISRDLEETLELWQESVAKEVERRGELVAGEMRNQLFASMSGAKSGRIYPFRGGFYQASASGEVPALRSGALADSYQERVSVDIGASGRVFSVGLESSLRVGSYLLGDLLENGTKSMAPRPFRQEVIDRVLPYAAGIYGKSYDF